MQQGHRNNRSARELPGCNVDSDDALMAQQQSPDHRCGQGLSKGPSVVFASSTSTLSIDAVGKGHKGEWSHSSTSFVGRPWLEIQRTGVIKAWSCRTNDKVHDTLLRKHNRFANTEVVTNAVNDGLMQPGLQDAHVERFMRHIAQGRSVFPKFPQHYHTHDLSGGPRALDVELELHRPQEYQGGFPLRQQRRHQRFSMVGTCTCFWPGTGGWGLGFRRRVLGLDFWTRSLGFSTSGDYVGLFMESNSGKS